MIGSDYPIRIQTMANTNTNDIEGSIAQARRCFETGAELLRYTTQGMKEVESLAEIHKHLRAPQDSSSSTPNQVGALLPSTSERSSSLLPLVADIHFRSDVADAAAAVVEKVRINPGNYIDPARTFKQLEYTDQEYSAELARLRTRFCAFLNICRAHHTAIRIGVNHGSLSDRIMSRYGDTPAGIVESCMEFLRIAVDEHFTDIVISIKASNTRVMVDSVRLLVQTMDAEGMAFPLHLGVTEAGEGEDGRIKSAVGIGALLADGIGDTIRVSLSEPPENELPVARVLRDYFVSQDSPRYHGNSAEISTATPNDATTLYYTGTESDWDEFCLHAAAECGHLLWDNHCTNLVLNWKPSATYHQHNINITSPTLAKDLERLSQDILQAARIRMYKTEFISCPGCGRTMFNLENTIARVKAATQHLSGLKIGVMGCIVNGPGEMADADYGYVGAGRDKISLYHNKECVMKNIPQDEAVEALVELIRANGDWIEPLSPDEP